MMTRVAENLIRSVSEMLKVGCIQSENYIRGGYGRVVCWRRQKWQMSLRMVLTRS